MRSGAVLFFAVIVVILAAAIALHSASGTRAGTIRLLTIAETYNGTRGGIADLRLEIRPGSGRVFIDSFPMTKLDTQLSARIANEIACDFTGADCSRYDFFYALNAESSIVGGPSAGSGFAVLTAMLLEGKNPKGGVAVTGTINSGGLIGPVSGLKKKIIAAEQEGLKLVLIPGWDIEMPGFLLNASNVSMLVNISDNQSISLNFTEISGFFEEETGFGRFFENSSVKIVRVLNLADAVSYFTGQNHGFGDARITVPDYYSAKMKEVSSSLCSRSDELKILSEIITSNPFALPSLANSSKSAEVFRSKAVDAMENERYYSAASFCFSANIVLEKIILSSLGTGDLKIEYENVLKGIRDFEAEIDSRNLATISDLEVYMVVKERLVEARNLLEEMNSTLVNSSELAYAKERYLSAVAWAEFFGMPGQRLRLDNQYLRTVCLKKIEETEVRIGYMGILYPGIKDSMDDEIKLAYSYLKTEDYPLCIFKASKAKAGANLIMSSFYLSRDQIGSYMEKQFESAEWLIARQQQKGFFPILGYSYYEYATDLHASDPISGFLFSEYSLEISSIDKYFPSKKSLMFPSSPLFSYFGIFILGIFLGVIFVLVIVSLLVKDEKGNRVKQRKKTG